MREKCFPYAIKLIYTLNRISILVTTRTGLPAPHWPPH